MLLVVVVLKVARGPKAGVDRLSVDLTEQDGIDDDLVKDSHDDAFQSTHEARRHPRAPSLTSRPADLRWHAIVVAIQRLTFVACCTVLAAATVRCMPRGYHAHMRLDRLPGTLPPCLAPCRVVHVTTCLLMLSPSAWVSSS